jgi:hypothetical protein
VLAILVFHLTRSGLGVSGVVVAEMMPGADAGPGAGRSHSAGAASPMSPGLYFPGLSRQHTRGSALLGFDHEDAAHLAGVITRSVRANPAPTRPASQRSGRPV